MAKQRVTTLTEELTIDFIKDKELELVDVEFVKEGPHWFLRVYIDKEDGVTLDDCQCVSTYLSKKLDEMDPIEQNYYLEVSSPGLDRPLKKEKDFEKYKGRQIQINLYEPIEGQKMIEGELIGLEDGNVVLKVKDKEMRIKREKAAKVKLAIMM